MVSDGLAGKKAMCKECGNKMVVPGASGGISAGGAAPVPRARPVPPPETDIYGLNEEPSALPTMAWKPAVAESMESPVKKKPRKKGFFSMGGGKKSAGSSGGGMSGLSILRLVIGIAVAAFFGIRGLGLSSSTEVRAVLVRQLDMSDEFVAALDGIKSTPDAAAASPRILDILNRMQVNLESNRTKKARINDINRIARELKPRAEAMKGRLTSSMMRVAMIPGALAALNIEGPLQRLAALEEELGREGKAQGIDAGD